MLLFAGRGKVPTCNCKKEERKLGMDRKEKERHDVLRRDWRREMESERGKKPSALPAKL